MAEAPKIEPVDDASAATVPVEGQLRRRAAHLYGLILCGAVLAASTDASRLFLVAAAMVGTLVVYWVAESYAHWMSARMVLGRGLTRAEERAAVLDGFPLVAASTIPVLVLLLEALLSIETSRALRIALWVNVLLLLAVGWRMSSAGGLRGWRRVGLTAMTGLLGIAMVVLKSLLH